MPREYASHAEKIDGIKVSLLDAGREVETRRRLPEGVRMYTGDAFDYPDLIRGDEEGFSTRTFGTHRATRSSISPRSGICNMPEGATTPFPKALYLLDGEAFEKIYGEEERTAVAGLADVYAPPQTADSVAKNPNVLADVEVILSGWGAPTMNGAFLEMAPNLRVVLYGAGSIRRVATPALWNRGVRITSAYAANAVPVSEFALAAILFSLKRGWHFAFSAREGLLRAKPGPRRLRQHCGPRLPWQGRSSDARAPAAL
jgi:hypothetical protein